MVGGHGGNGLKLSSSIDCLTLPLIGLISQATVFLLLKVFSKSSVSKTWED